MGVRSFVASCTLLKKPRKQLTLFDIGRSAWYDEHVGKRQREWAKRKREELISFLGGKCVRCDATENLEFDHIYGTTWIIKKKASDWRISVYNEEAKRGLIQLLCKECNLKKAVEDAQCDTDDLLDAEVSARGEQLTLIENEMAPF